MIPWHRLFMDLMDRKSEKENETYFGLKYISVDTVECLKFTILM